MQLALHRKIANETCTIGELSVTDDAGNTEFWCCTLEDALRPDGVKIPGESCIPAGDYEVQITWSPRFGQMMPLVISVPNFTGIRIHVGNTAKDTDGCILVGESTDNVQAIFQSRDAFDLLFTGLTEAIGRGEKIDLTITNDAEPPAPAVA